MKLLRWLLSPQTGNVDAKAMVVGGTSLVALGFTLALIKACGG